MQIDQGCLVRSPPHQMLGLPKVHFIVGLSRQCFLAGLKLARILHQPLQIQAHVAGNASVGIHIPAEMTLSLIMTKQLSIYASRTTFSDFSSVFLLSSMFWTSAKVLSLLRELRFLRFFLGRPLILSAFFIKLGWLTTNSLLQPRRKKPGPLSSTYNCAANFA